MRVAQRRSELVFPSQSTGKAALRHDVHEAAARFWTLAAVATAHGFRSAFRDWRARSTRCARSCRGRRWRHSVRDKTEGAYRRAADLERTTPTDGALGSAYRPRGMPVPIAAIRSKPPWPLLTLAEYGHSRPSLHRYPSLMPAAATSREAGPLNGRGIGCKGSDAPFLLYRAERNHAAAKARDQRSTAYECFASIVGGLQRDPGRFEPRDRCERHAKPCIKILAIAFAHVRSDRRDRQHQFKPNELKEI